MGAIIRRMKRQNVLGLVAVLSLLCGAFAAETTYKLQIFLEDEDIKFLNELGYSICIVRCGRLRSRRRVAQHPPESHVAEQRAGVDGRLLRVPPGDDPGGWRHVALYHANTNAIAAVVDIPDHIRRLQGAGNAWHCCGARRAPVDPHAGTGAEGQWTSEAAWGHPECERHHGEHGAEGVRVCVHWTQPGERAAEPDGGEQPCQGGVLQDDVDGGEVSQGIGSVHDHTHSLKMRSGRLVTNP